MLYDKLKKNNKIPFHMPGHKRNTKLLGSKFPYDIDITEIDGFDNLHCPEGILKDIEEKAERIYGSKKSFLLVNGSTGGILAAVNAIVKRGDNVLIARNCHKSVYNALELAGANVQYIYPEKDEYGIFKPLNPYIIKCKISKFSPKLLILTSPTYEGVCSDIESICEIAHSYNIPVLLDAAHGAHITELGSSADIVIMSLHKTLPALTQCSIAHINGDIVSAEKFRIKLSVFETSSPSYILMASIDECLTFLEKKSFEFILKRNNLSEGLSGLKVLKAVGYDDIFKLVIFTGNSNITGINLSDILRKKYNIEVEMASKNYILLILTDCDDYKNYKILLKALKEIDDSLEYRDFSDNNITTYPDKIKDIYIDVETGCFDFESSAGKVSAEYIWAYPPGIPIIVPGEVISEDIIDYIKHSISEGVNIQSTYSQLPEKIYCQLL